MLVGPFVRTLEKTTKKRREENTHTVTETATARKVKTSNLFVAIAKGLPWQIVRLRAAGAGVHTWTVKRPSLAAERIAMCNSTRVAASCRCESTAWLASTNCATARRTFCTIDLLDLLDLSCFVLIVLIGLSRLPHVRRTHRYKTFTKTNKGAMKPNGGTKSCAWVRSAMTCGDVPLCKGTTVTITADARKRTVLRRCATVEAIESVPCSCHSVSDFPAQKKGPDGQTVRTKLKVGGATHTPAPLLKSVHVGACARCVLLRCVDVVGLIGLIGLIG